MKQEIIIGVSVTIAVGVLFAIKYCLQHLLTFKIDESVILNFFKDTGDNETFRSTEAISAGTDLTTDRVSVVCSKSTAIRRNAKNKESWGLKQ